MAEIILGADDDATAVVQALLALAGDQPDQVAWSPRPDVPQGGVYVVPDELAAAFSGGGPTGRGKRAKAAAAAEAAAAVTAPVPDGFAGTAV